MNATATAMMAARQDRPEQRMDALTRAIRNALEDADRRYWRAAAEAVRHAGSAEAALDVRYPEISGLDDALAEAGADGWRDAETGIVARIWKGGRGWIRGIVKRMGTATAGRTVVRPLQRHGGATATARHGRATAMLADAGTIDDALELLVMGERTVVPQEAIARYVASRIPPLAETIDNRRRELCRDLVTQAAGDGLGTRDIMELLQSSGFGTSAWHRETIARTETGQLYNHGRVARYRASGACPGYRYEAIIDGRETVICRGLNGKLFNFEDANGATPPMHYACRSTISPVMWWEVPENWDQPGEIIDGLEPADRPAAGFGGIDMSDMPEPQDLNDFIGPLRDSEDPEIREIGAAIARWRKAA